MQAAAICEGVGTIAGSQYCAAAINQADTTGWLWAVAGMRFAARSSVAIVASDFPLKQFCVFVVGQGPGVTPNPGGSTGDLCISGGIGRYNGQVAPSDPAGALSLLVNPAAIPTAGPLAVFGQGRCLELPVVVPRRSERHGHVELY